MTEMTEFRVASITPSCAEVPGFNVTWIMGSPGTIRRVRSISGPAIGPRDTTFTPTLGP